LIHDIFIVNQKHKLEKRREEKRKENVLCIRHQLSYNRKRVLFKAEKKQRTDLQIAKSEKTNKQTNNPT